MKHLVISCALFVSIIALVCADSYFVGKITDEILCLIDEVSESEDDYLSSENIEKIENILSQWEKNEIILDISVNRNYLDIAEDGIITLKESAQSSDYSNYVNALSFLKNTIKRIRDGSRISFLSIL